MLNVESNSEIEHLNGDLFPSKNFKVGELFAGAGGMALGAHNAKVDGYGFDHVWVNDFDKDACATFAKNFKIKANNVHCCRVEDLDFSTLSPIDGLAFGFPCNDFSMVGDRSGIAGEFGGLYRWGIKALKKLKPAFFIAENVSGLGSSGDNKDYQIILEALEESGYNIFPHTYFFENYGVPQARHRIIIVGFRRDLGINNFEHPRPTHVNNQVDCRTALSNIPENATNNERTKQSDRVVERLKYIKPGQNAFTADLPDHLKLSMKSGATISQIYKRLVADKPSYTVTGSGGGGTHIYHWEEPRALTNRERARLQSFPDKFNFLGGKESVRKQIGMAVPPKGAEVVFKAVLETLLKNNVRVDD